jgi:hypothetical protein
MSSPINEGKWGKKKSVGLIKKMSENCCVTFPRNIPFTFVLLLAIHIVPEIC